MMDHKDQVGPQFPRLTRAFTQEETETLCILVLHQAFRDANQAAKQRPDRPNTLTCKLEEAEEARAWLTTFSDDLEIVCGWAGVEPYRVINNAQRQAEEGWVTPPPQRAGKGLGISAFQAESSPDEEEDS